MMSMLMTEFPLQIFIVLIDIGRVILANDIAHEFVLLANTVRPVESAITRADPFPARKILG